ncbi:MAG: hypothetical protein Q4C36_04370, partial [Coriobacteriia bacterium]|nr:hypothetical protein [Coriobacteriia bacterium]
MEGQQGIAIARESRLRAMRNARACRALLVSILALAVIAMLAGCSGGSSSSAGSEQSSESSTAAQPAVELDEAVEFGGISFQIPKGWVAVKAENGGMYYYPSDSDHTSIIHVLESDLQVAEGQEKEAFSGILGGVLGTEDENPKDLKTEDYSVDGYPAQRVTYTGTLGGSPFSLHFVTVLHDGKASMLMGGSPSPEAPYDAAFAACIDSIHVVASPADAPSEAVSESASSSAEPEKTEASEANNGLIDAEKFDAIKQGMSYDEVVSLIGSEGELLSSSSVAGIETASYKWESDGWGIATIMFQDGVVVNKSQVGVGGSAGVKAT